MEWLLYGMLFVVSLILAAWLPARSVFPRLSAQIVQMLSTIRI